MNYVLYAVPFFFLLIGIELIADRWRGMNNYRTADALNSLSTGVLLARARRWGCCRWMRWGGGCWRPTA